MTGSQSKVIGVQAVGSPDKPTIFEALAAQEYAFWFEVRCPVCEEIVLAYHFTIKEIGSEVEPTLKSHEAWCKSPSGIVEVAS